MTSSNIQRKLVAILCADVVGYSRLMGEDEAATLNTLTEYRQVFFDAIEKNRGRLVNAPGDSILAEFASVMEGVECAAEIQKTLSERNEKLSEARRMLFRIGINLGDVMVREEELYGDGVNISARLESIALPGGICVSRPVYEQVKQKLSLHFEYMGEQTLKNISQPVEAYQIINLPDDATSKSARAHLKTPSLTNEPRIPDTPSIAVMPFKNKSADPNQEYFSEGLSEDIITDLSKLSGLMVIARHSSFSYKQKDVSISQIGQELGVKYVLEGSVRKADNHARINAQLVEAQLGNHLWAERYDRDVSEIFAVQDEITSEIVTALDVKLLRGDQARIWRKSLKNIKARDLYYQARDPWHSQTKEGLKEARRLYHEVIQLEPDSPLAYAQIAWSLWIEVLVGLSDNPPQSLAQALEMATQALERDPLCGEASAVLGAIHTFQRNFEEALVCGKEAYQNSPNSADVIQNYGFILLFAGKIELALEMVERAIRLCPVCPAFYLNILGVILRELGRYEEAIEALKKGIALESKMLTIRFALVSVYCAAERYPEAHDLHREILTLEPSFSLGEYAKRLPFKDPSVNARVIAHLEMGGLA